MKNIRNIVILGHLQSGKTTLAETLYAAATGNQKGSVDAGTSISDYTPEEKSRKSSVHSAILPLEYKGTKINLIDCPGSDDFITDTISAISVVKGAVLLLDASKGVEVGTVKHWNFLRKKNIPTIIYVNKMDKPDVHFDKLMDDIRTKLGKNAIPFCYPMGHNDGFDGFGINIEIIKSRSNQAGQKVKVIYDKVRGIDPVRTCIAYAKEQGSIGGNKNALYFINNKDKKFPLRTVNEFFRENREMYKIMYDHILPSLQEKLSSVSEDDLDVVDEIMDY